MGTGQSRKLRRLFHAAIGRDASERLAVPADWTNEPDSRRTNQVGDLELTDEQVRAIRTAGIICWASYIWPGNLYR